MLQVLALLCKGRYGSCVGGR